MIDVSSATQASGVISVRLLGDLQVQVGGATVEGLRSGRVRSLLAYLVLHPDVANSRQRMAFMFWPDSSEGQARTNLRNVLHQLRRAHPALAAAVHVTPTTLQWQPVAAAEVDVERFLAAAHAATAVDPDDAAELITRCRSAADLYPGDLLVGDQDEWLTARRAELRDRYLDVLRRLTTALIDQGRAGEATATAHRLVDAEPLDESAHRLRIEAHDRAGDRAGAVRAYHECVATLARELGVAPGSATTALYGKLLEGGQDAPASPPPHRSGGVGHRLVGRERELHNLLAAWEAAQRGPPSFVLVSGEPGIGKTRLVDELRAWCTESAATVGVARSYAIEGTLGFAVLASWLRSPDVARGRSSLAEDHLRELARLLPELGRPPTMQGTDEATLRRRLFDVAVAALTASARPTLLIADDIQWSDPASLQFVHYMIHQPLDVPLLVVATCRTDDFDHTLPLTTLLDALTAVDRLTELRLERLPLAATGELASEAMGRALAADAVDALFVETDGNPLFVVETVRAGWDGQHPATLSPRLRAVIDARFRQLSEHATAVLRSAAVVGRPCTGALLASVSGLDQRSLVQGIDELWRRGILSETGTDAYEFSHGKLGDAAYDDLSPATRRALHSSVADALVHAAGEGDPAANEIAFHLEAANRTDLAITWLQRAALDAQRTFDYREATRLLDRALGFVEQLPADVRHGRELELLSTLPGALAGVDGYGTPRMSLAQHRAVEVAAHLGVELEPALERSVVMSALCRDEFGAAMVTSERLGARALATGNTALQLESHYLMGISAFWAAELDKARRHFEVVIQNFDATTSRDHQLVYGHDPKVVCLSRWANTMWFLGRDDDARTACDEALAIAAAVGHPLSHDTAVIFACVLAIDLGDHDRLRSHVPHLGELGMDSVPHATKREALIGLVDVLDGRPADGLQRIQAALDRCDGHNFYPGFQATILRALLAAHEAAGDAIGGLATVERALALGSTPLWNAEAHRLRATFLHATGSGSDAVASAIETASAVARHQGAAAHLRRIEQTRDRLRAL